MPLSSSWRGSPLWAVVQNALASVSRAWSDEDLGLEADDLFRNPALGVLAAKEDVQQGIDRAQLGEEEEGHHRRAGDREPEPDLVAPGKLHQANEVFHNVREMPRTGRPIVRPCIIGALE